MRRIADAESASFGTGIISVVLPMGIREAKVIILNITNRSCWGTKEIITADVYGDTQEIIEDCLYAIESFIEEVMSDYNKEEHYDYTDVFEMENLTDKYWIAA